MPSIYVSKETKKNLYKFINRSRVSPEFGSPNKFKTPNEAISFLLEIGLKYPLSSLEKIANQVFVQGSIRMTDSEFEEFEQSGEFKKMVEKELQKAEEDLENEQKS